MLWYIMGDRYRVRAEMVLDVRGMCNDSDQSKVDAFV